MDAANGKAISPSSDHIPRLFGMDEALGIVKMIMVPTIDISVPMAISVEFVNAARVRDDDLGSNQNAPVTPMPTGPGLVLLYPPFGSFFGEVGILSRNRMLTDSESEA